MKVTVTWNNAGPHTIWAKLAEELGREPTNAEAAERVRQILAGETYGAADVKRNGLDERQYR